MSADGAVTADAVEPGATVRGSDGETLGKVMEVGADYVVVERGLLSPADYVVPLDAIGSVSGEGLTLRVTRDEALAQGWDGARASDAPASGPSAPNDIDGDEVPEANLSAPGMAAMLGTTVPAADFATLGVAPVDSNTAYTGDDDAPGPDDGDLPVDGFPAGARPGRR